MRKSIGHVTNPGSASGGDPPAKWKRLITDRKKAGKELSFEKLSSAFGQAMQQLVKEIEMELPGKSATEARPTRRRCTPRHRHWASVKAGDRSPCERGWISQWALPHCTGRPRSALSRSFHRRARLSPPASSVFHRASPKPAR